MRYSESYTFRILMIVTSFLSGLIIPVILFFLPVTVSSEGVIGKVGPVHSVVFNESLWDKVQAGMSEAEVKSVIGEPYSIGQLTSQDKRTLIYRQSNSKEPEHFEYHVIIKDGKVLEKKKEILED